MGKRRKSRKQFSKKSKKGTPKRDRRTSPKRLQAQLEQIQGELEQARAEREYLQNQLEWVLYYLESLDPPTLYQTLDSISQGMGADNPLPSEVGIDYQPLQEMLAHQDWQQADEQTWMLLLQAFDKEGSDVLTSEDMENFPSTDLQTINWLWEAYSEGRFGLRVQQEVWEMVGGDYGAFCDRVGWRSASQWLYYEDLTFSLSAATGHLPVLGWRRRSCYGVGSNTARESMAYLLQRFREVAGEQE